VTVPDTYYIAVWQDQLRGAGQPSRAPTSDELQQIHREVDAGLEEIVGQLFPSDQAVQPVATVAIASVPDVPPATLDPVPRWNTRPSIVVSIILLLVVGCALALAGFIRDLVSQATPALVADAGPRGTTFHKPSVASFTESATRSEGAPSEREELVRLVRTNPAAAAATLRSWVEPTS
jgi:hypothetical protein